MRIGVLSSLYPSGPRPYEGIFAQERWTRMARRGHAVAVVAPQPRTPWPFVTGAWAEIHRMARRETREGLPVSRPRYLHLPRSAPANARRFARAGLGELLAGEHPDVVVADYAWPAAAAAPELVRAGVPCLVSGRGSDVLQVAQIPELAALLANGLRAAGHWCAVSADLVAAMDALAERPGRGLLVPNGVDLERFRIGDRAAARRTLGLDADGPLVLVVGHLIDRKDPLLALEVFDRGAPPDARLVFVGRGPLRGALAEAVARRGLGARVRLAGEAAPETLADWYAACDLLLLTSSREGRPNVVLEALACGRPVLATPAGGTAELLQDLPGMLAEGRDPERLAERLGALLARSPAEEVLRRAVEHLSWETSTERLERALERTRAGVPADAR